MRLLVMAVDILIDLVKDNPIQEWLGDGFFGRHIYQTAEAEIQALKAIGN